VQERSGTPTVGEKSLRLGDGELYCCQLKRGGKIQQSAAIRVQKTKRSEETWVEALMSIVE
jgi:hypothetical protein